MITEEHLAHILKEMDYHLTGLANEIDPQKFGADGIIIDEQFFSFKYVQQKAATLKHHIDWIRVDMQEDGA